MLSSISIPFSQSLNLHTGSIKYSAAASYESPNANLTLLIVGTSLTFQ